jgi:hypothetical protein
LISILLKFIEISQIMLKLLNFSLIRMFCFLKHISVSEVAVAQNPVHFSNPHVPDYKISS